MTAAPTTLSALLRDVAEPGALGDIVVRGLALDSRVVGEGEAFVALAGTRYHGIAFAPAALARGASVVLAESGIEQPASRRISSAPATNLAENEPVVWIPNLRAHLGDIASRFFGAPSRALTVIGVTGTNGKTSTVQLLAQALTHAGRKTATIGTLGAGLHGALREGERTTPDVIAIHGLLAEFRDAGATHVAMEVSSHALDQGRVDGVAFDLAVFTNLTRDHLDYHGTMQNYGAAKERLFAWPGLGAAIINVDDAFGRALIAALPTGVPLLRYGTADDADVAATSIQATSHGLVFDLRTPWGEGRIETHLLGRFNVSNLLAVAASLGQLGFSFGEIRDALATLQPVPGRMSRLGGEANLPLVIVDYSHTPDALEQALTSSRAHCTGALTVVFGCGGDRDAGKRPQMGALAEALADRVIITDDNPRGEDGTAIVADILTGLKDPPRAIVERDRARAIARAVRDAKAGDVVLVAGKGHEPYQEIAGVKHPFDDLVVARNELEARAC